MKAAVIGAGIAGSACARLLKRTGHESVLFDKSRGAGGRLSTRRRDGVQFDFGAPVLSAQSSAFTRALATWMKAGSAVQWPGRFGYLRDGILHHEQNAPARFIGTPTMNAVVKQLQVELDVRYQHRVERLEKNGRRWNVLGADGHSFGEFDIVALAVPAPQAVQLLDGVSPLAESLATVHMDPCWSVMAAWDTPLAIDFDALELSEPLGWATRETRKPHRPDGEAWVIHASSDWSTEHLEAEPDWVAQHILDAFFQSISVKPTAPRYLAAHRWRYSRVRNPLGVECLWDGAQRVGACGDMCLGGRIENAYLSGRALAQTIGRGGFK